MLTADEKKALRTYIQQTNASADRMADIGMMSDADVIAMLQAHVYPERIRLLTEQESDAQGIINRHTDELVRINAERTVWACIPEPVVVEPEVTPDSEAVE